MLVVRKFKNDNETRPRFISVPILFRDIIYEPRHSDIIQVNSYVNSIVHKKANNK